ncbi:MAG TPA: hypothetical protein VGI39_39770 [Polyangiaceae bacterium]|jgi:hypothetical protein
MSEVKYEVVVEYKLQGDLKAQLQQLSGGTVDLDVRLRGARQSTERMGGSMRGASSQARALWDAVQGGAGRAYDAFTGVVEQVGMFTRGLAMAGGAAAIGAVTYGVVSLNSELEKTQIALADILTSNGVTSDLNAGMGKSADLMKQIRKDAAALPGETSDLANIFKLAAIPGLAAGQSVDRVEKLSASAMAYGMGTVGLNGEVTARELQGMLSGRAGSHNVLSANLGFIGSKATTLNKMGEAERFLAVEKELEKHSGSIALYANSFEGVWSTLKDSAKLLLSNATSPLFEHVKKTITDVSGWLDHNQGSISVFTGRLGDGLAHAWDRGVQIFQEWAPAVETFTRGLYNDALSLWQSIRPEVEAIANALRTSLADGSALKRLESILRLYGELKIAGAAAPAVGSAVQAFGGIKGLLGGGAAAEGSGLLGGAGGGGSILATAAGGAAVGALAVAATAAAGEVLALGDANSKYHEQASAAAEDLATQFGRVAHDVWGSGSFLSNALQSVGQEATIEAAGLSRIIANIAEMTPGQWLGGERGAAIDAAMDTFKQGLKDDVFTPAYGDAPLDFFRAGLGPMAPPKDDDAAKKKATPPTTINVNNVFNISSNHDPSRIARNVVSMMGDTLRFPTQSRHVRNPASVRG